MKYSIGLMLLLLVGTAGAAAAEGLRPMPRPAGEAVTGLLARPVPLPADADLPGNRQETEPTGTPAAEGPVCRSNVMLGQRLPAVDGAGACGIGRPVSLSSVAGVVLEPQPTLSCDVALALQDWLEDVAKPALEAGGSPLVGLRIAAGYVCRNVNYAEDGQVSEHARGRAIDISGFQRADGSHVSVLDAWGSPAYGDLLREIHQGACGIFNTTIGPDSDALHADHFHYDLAERRRPYCP